MLFVHSVPFISLLINLVYTKITFIKSHYCHSMVLGFIYIFFNYYGSMERGKNLYPIIRWENKVEVTFVVIALILFVGYVLHPMSCAITVFLKKYKKNMQ